MKKVYTKLFFTVISILVSVVMVGSVSYAWMVLSKSPSANGISVMIGGGKTILLAPDLTKTVIDEQGEKQIVHYPGTFSDTLDFTKTDTYDVLSKVSGLMPVSSADGRYWMIPAYDEDGDLLPIDQFLVDDSLEYANRLDDGCYVYLDFWIVSPGSDYNVRVSMDSKTQQGSYLMELPGVTTTEDGGLTLGATQNIVSASARIGFLVNHDPVEDADLTAYMQSAGFDDRYYRLVGIYPENGEAIDPVCESTFLIYEPNAFQHPSGSMEEGSYWITEPLGYDPWTESIQETDISRCLVVQANNLWRPIDSGITLEQQFQTAVAGKHDLTVNNAQGYFYRTFLQGQLSPYIASGLFVQNTQDLYDRASDGVVSQTMVSGLSESGASGTGVITRLQRNTPQRIRMYVWIEGQDADCRNATKVQASQIALKMELAGSTE